MESIVHLMILCLISSIVSGQNRRYVLANGNSSSTTLLERINDRLTALQTLDEQQLKKLDALEYKLTTLEATDKERSEATKAEIREMSRRTQNLDWGSSKTESTLDLIRNEVEAIRQNLDNNGLRLTYQQASSPSNTDIDIKLEGLGTYLTSTRDAVYKLQRHAAELSKNISHLLHGQKEIRQHLSSMPTKQHLNGAVHTLRNNHPIYAVMQNPSGQISDGEHLPKNCDGAAVVRSGLLKIQVNPMKEPFYVMCDGETEEGGWTLIQHRKDGTINFNRPWMEYKFGFGNLASEFWIGLEKLHEMTSSELQELLIVLEDFNGERRQAKYKYFAIGGEKEDYALNVLGIYEGTAGDSLSYSAAHKFSTFDTDNDGWVEGNCALAHTGAWWHNACEKSNLNGQYFGGEVPNERLFQGIYWEDFHGPNYSLKSVKMMIRPVERSP